jgi:hypothetical protein
VANSKDLPWYIWASPVGLAAAGVTSLAADDQKKDIEAIKKYVTEMRPKIARFPKIQPLIDSFEQWYEKLTWYDLNVSAEKTLAEARRRKYDIEKLTGDLPDPTVVPGDAWKGYAKVPAPIPKEEKPFISTPWKIGLALGSGLLIFGLGSVYISKKTNPIARAI